MMTDPKPEQIDDPSGIIADLIIEPAKPEGEEDE